jgi:hypothetical protein
MLAVDVDFEIAGFKPQTFWLYAVFPMTALGSTAPDSLVPEVLEAAAGRARLCIPLADVYDNTMVKWPLSMHMTIHKARLPGSEIIARSAPIELNSVDVPDGALARQAAAPPLEYYDSLTKVAEFFNSRRVRYKVCIERFPNLQPRLTPAYRAWETRHREQVDVVSRLEFALLKVMAGGQAGRAVEIQDGIRTATLQAHRNTPEPEYRRQCDLALEDFADTEDLSDLAISDELEVIRKHDSPPAAKAQREDS